MTHDYVSMYTVVDRKIKTLITNFKIKLRCLQMF